MEADDVENLSESSKHNDLKTNVLSADSGLSEDDFSIVSETTSEFSLLEIPSAKDNDEKGEIEQGSSLSGAERSIGEQNIHRPQESSSLENTGTHGQSVEKKDIARKASSSSSTNDFSILEMPENGLEENDVEEDSDAKNILDNLVIPVLPDGTKKDSQPSSMGSNSPGDCNSHESSVLGSSFAVIGTSDKSSSYPSSFDDSIDRSKIQVLPPKEDTEISTSIDEHGNKVTKKKSMHGGIVEVVVQREDWKLKEDEKLNNGAVETVEDLPDSEQMKNYIKNKDIGEDEKLNIGAVETAEDLPDSEQMKNDDKNKDMQDQIVQGTETVTDVDPVVKETDTTQSDICQNDGKRDEVKVENSMDTEMVTDRYKADKIKTQEHYDVIADTGSLNMATSQKDEEISTEGEIHDVERKDQGEITDVERRNQQKYLDKNEILGEQQVEEDKEIQVGTQNNQDGTHFVADEDRKPLGDFSVVHKSEFSENNTSRQFGKSDVDSDIVSSNSETRSRSSTISIYMDELEIDTSDESNEPRTKLETSGESGDNEAEISEKQLKGELIYSDMVVQKEENSSVEDLSLLDKSELDTDSSAKILTNEIQQTGEEEDKPVITKEDEKEIRSRSVSDASTASSVSPEVWQPPQGFRMTTEDEEILEKRLKKQHALQVHLRYSFGKSRSHESEMKKFEIKMENVLEWGKWEYVLSRKDKLLVKRFPEIKFNFDESYGKLDLVIIKPLEDEEEVMKWYSEVIEEVKRQITKIDSCIICCLQEKVDLVLSQLKGVCSAMQLDADVEFSQQRVSLLNEESLNENVIVVTGSLGNVTSVLLEKDVNSVKLYHSYQGHLVTLILCSIPINTIQHDVFVKFEAERALITKFPDVHVKMLSDTLKLFVRGMYVDQVLNFINEKWLKFKHVSKITLKHLEFTLLCKTSVKNYIVGDKLHSSEYDYKWKFFPIKGEIILYTENQQQSDEIKDSIFSSFIEHKIKLDNIQMVDVSKADEWLEIVKEVEDKSEGMAEITLNDDQTVVTIIGTDDIMTAWEKFGTLAIIEQNVLKITGKSKACPLEENRLVKKIVTMDGHNLNAVHRQKMANVQEACNEMNVELVSTDIGFEVIGSEESLVNDICERLLQISHEVVNTEQDVNTVKRFVQMEEQEIDLVYNKKMTDLQSYSKELEVEFDITNLGYEVKGKTESHVKKFCDFLIEMKQETNCEQTVLANELQDGEPEIKQETSHGKAVLANKVEDGERLSDTINEEEGADSVLEQKLVKNFVQLDDSIIQFIEKFKMVELQEIMANLDFSGCCTTSLGFEVSGSKDIDVQTICKHLKRLNLQIETRKVEIPSKLSEGNIQKLEQKYKCIVKLLDDTDQATDDTDAAVWYINGINMSVSVKDLEEITCDVIITPMDEKQKESNQKFIYQEKHKSEEVNIPAPQWTQESGKEKHMLNDLFLELLEDLDKKSYSIVALPVLGFNGWPPVKLTKVMVLSLSKFCEKVNRCNIQKIILYSTDTNVCVKVIDAIENALPSLKREGRDVGHINKPNMALLSESTECNSTPEMLAKQQPQVKTDMSSAASESEPPMEIHATDDNHQPLPTLVEVKITPAIFIMKGFIAKQEVDAIVNTTSPDFDLKNGAVSKSILDAAGKNIQKEIKANAHNTLRGEIVITKGHNLKCKAVFHGALEGYDEKRSTQQKSVKLLNRFVTNCLYAAHERNYKSIAFPALGTGALDFPPDVVATEMMKMIEEFRNRYPHSTLSEIRIVIYRDEGIYMIFQKITDDFKESLMRTLSECNATAPVKPPVTLNMSTKDKLSVAVDLPKEIDTLVGPDLPTQGINLDVGRISLSAGLGDVTKLEGFDCLILLWPQDEIFSTPADKKIILQSVGHSSIKQWETGRSSLSDSKVLVTPGGGLPQKTIIHVYVDNYRIHEAFVLGLTKAEELHMLSVVIPVRPSDLLAKDVEVFSTCIFRAVTENCYRFNMIRHVRICIGGKHLCQPILATLAKLQETDGSQNESKKETTVYTIQITALKDDMASIMAEIKPQADVVKDVKISEDIEVKDKTLTKDDIEQYTKSPSEIIVNVIAEISADVIDAVRQRNQLSLMKSTIERSSEQVKVREDHGKWLICMPSLSYIEICQKSVHQFWENFLNDKSDLQGEKLHGDSVERVVIKAQITNDLFQAIMLLEKRKLSEIIGNVKTQHLEKSGSLEITGQALCKNAEQRIKTLISNFQTNMTMDVIEVPYRQLKQTSQENFVTKLQAEYPDVYIYIERGNGAEASFNVYFVSLNRESLSSAKRGIQTEYLKTTNRAGRFTQSQYKDKNTNHQGQENFSRSFSLPDRNPKPRNFRTKEGLKICVYMADMRTLSVDCIVNAANGQLMHGGGIAAVIADAAGRTFNKECSDYVKSYGEIKTGECCVTNAGRLPYKRVIHAVGPQWTRCNANKCCDLLQKTIEQCIQMANTHEMKSVAIPSISAGLYGMPPDLCAKSYGVGVMTVSAKKTARWSLQEIHFVDNKPDMVFKVQTAFSDLFENGGTRRQKSVEEHFQSLTSVDQIKGNEIFLKKVNEIVSKNETFVASVPATATVVRSHGTLPSNEENTQPVQQPCRFTINQSLHQQGSFPDDVNLPSSWLVTVKNNLMEIKTDLNFNVLIYEHDFGKLQIESIAFGQDIDYGTSRLIKSMGSTSTFKAKLKQLRVQLPTPNIGTVAAFESVSGNYIQNVFIVFTPKYSKESSPSAMKKFCDHLYGCYLKLFLEAVNTPGVEYLAVSFLKTGNTGISFEEGANIFFQAINTFSTGKDPHCTLKQVHLILNKSSSAFKAIQSVLEKNFDGRGHLERVNEKISKRDLLIIGCKLINSKENENVTLVDEKSETENVEEKTPVTTEKSQPETCAICLEEVQDDNKKILLKCKHEFCKHCIEECFQHKPVCPTCGTVYGVIMGNQPKGTMRVEHRPRVHLPGYPKKGHHEIHYSFQSGTQTDEHHNPGMHYKGTCRKAYLPADDKGTMVMKLLQIAFDRKLVFTIGHSRTTGEENVVTWNDIHHKTNMSGGAQGFGYPDPQYLNRVLEELAAKGVTEADLK